MGLLWPIRALKINGRVGTKFEDHLPAGATGRANDSMIVGYRNCFDFNLRTQLSDSGKDRRALGTIRHTVRGVFYVATGKDLPIPEKNGRSHVEI